MPFRARRLGGRRESVGIAETCGEAVFVTSIVDDVRNNLNLKFGRDIHIPHRPHEFQKSPPRE